MNEIASTTQTGLTPLRLLAEEARAYSDSLALNMINLGRVFVEAKAQVEHGKWAEWVRLNAGMSERSAQQLMAIYSRFGTKPAFACVEKSKMYKMLALPDGTEEEFLEQNDVSEMTAREVEEAVRRVRQQAEAELAKERKARQEAEMRARELENRPAEIPAEISETLREKEELIAKQKAEMERIADIGKQTVAEANRLRAEHAKLERELRENSELLEETQEECNRAQSELLNLQSNIAKGDAERMPSDELTLDVFASSVRQFIGTCARMPHMGRTFGLMHIADKNAYDELLRTVEGWAADSRKALETYYEEVSI